MFIAAKPGSDTKPGALCALARKLGIVVTDCGDDGYVAEHALTGEFEHGYEAAEDCADVAIVAVLKKVADEFGLVLVSRNAANSALIVSRFGGSYDMPQTRREVERTFAEVLSC
jgi:hypothetical protein